MTFCWVYICEWKINNKPHSSSFLVFCPAKSCDWLALQRKDQHLIKLYDSWKSSPFVCWSLPVGFHDDGYTECAVCFEMYETEGDRVPKLLPCYHTLCLGCLKELVQGFTTVLCPECRKVSKVPCEYGMQRVFRDVRDGGRQGTEAAALLPHPVCPASS